MEMLLKNARVIDPSNNIDDVLDVGINGDVISEIGKNLDSYNRRVVNLEGLWLTPGLIDMHTHLREPGQIGKETIESGTAAAQAGGYTSVCCMANTSPIVDNINALSYIKEQAITKGKANVWPIAAVTKNLEGNEITNMHQLIENGVVAFSDDGRTIENTKTYRYALHYSSMFDVPIISHAEDTYLSEGGLMTEGYYSALTGMIGTPAASESIAVARELELLRFIGGRIHFAHITTKRALDLIRQAKSEGVKVTCETAPHYFVLTDQYMTTFDTFYKVNPPLRKEEDRKAVIEGLRDGTIDAIATDHAPHTSDEKARDLLEAPPGMIGLETSIGLILTFLVNNNTLSPMKAISCLTYGPAKILKIPRGSLTVGSIADMTIIDNELEWIVDSSKFLSKGRNTPFNGYKLKGKSVATIRNGILDKDLAKIKVKQL